MEYICKLISVSCREPADILFVLENNWDETRNDTDILKSLIHDVAVDLQVPVQFCNS